MYYLSPATQEALISWAIEVFDIEAQSVLGLKQYLDAQFAQVVQAILNSPGKVVVSGMGKSGLVGQKIAATLASTGTPSFFLHPAEAFHGDLGVVSPNDVVLLISNSGETNEILQIVPFFQENGNIMIGMSGRPNSTLAQNMSYHLCIKVEKEACPLDLAPTSSTTATLAMGDALAVALMKARDFKPEHFARFHPGGSLGRKLLGKVRHIMKKDGLPIIEPKASGMAVIEAISKGRIGLAVVSNQGTIQGIITDGDLRRGMERLREGFFSITAEEIMTKNPITINPDTSLSKAEEIMLSKKVASLLVTADEKLVGVVQIYDI